MFDNVDLTLVFLIILVSAFIVIYSFGQVDKIKQELGQAICSERIGKDYHSYNDGILKCKNKELKVAINYDGIIIELENTR